MPDRSCQSCKYRTPVKTAWETITRDLCWHDGEKAHYGRCCPLWVAYEGDPQARKSVTAAEFDLRKNGRLL